MRKINPIYLSLAAIPLILIAIFGIDDKKADFFNKGDGITAEYRIIYKQQMYYFGEMVSHWSMIATLSIVGILISTIVLVGIKESIKK